MTVVADLVVTVVPIAGPVLGGYLTEDYSWRAMFLLNLMPAAIITLCVLVFVHVD